MLGLKLISVIKRGPEIHDDIDKSVLNLIFDKIHLYIASSIIDETSEFLHRRQQRDCGRYSVIKSGDLVNVMHRWNLKFKGHFGHWETPDWLQYIYTVSGTIIRSSHKEFVYVTYEARRITAIIFKNNVLIYTFWKVKFCTSIQISLSWSGGLINNKLKLVQLRFWRQTGEKPLIDKKQ